MDLSANIEYEKVEEVLAESECETSTAELQAIICGMLAAGLKSPQGDWIDIVADVIHQDLELSPAAYQIMRNLYQWTERQINQHDAPAMTLLPDDSYPAVDQLEAVAEWCQGFLLGFGLQTANQAIDNHDVRESLTDISEISQLELEAEENEETQEALFTLIEHIKVAVQLIHWEMVVKSSAAIVTAGSRDQTLH